MIEKIKSPLDLKVGNYKGTEFDIIPAETFAMVCRKINELVDAINELQLVKDVMFGRIDMLNNAICDIQNRITALGNPTYHETEPKPADPIIYKGGDNE